ATGCGSGTETCVAGVWQSCSAQSTCECIPGSEASCAGNNTGECNSGFKTCLPSGAWGPCTGVVGPTAEICNDGLDNHCDGQVDEGQHQLCFSQCGAGTQSCQNGSWTACNAQQPQVEICDGIDNDCNGFVDEGCDCMPNQVQACGGVTSTCGAGTQTCDAM